MKAPPINIFSSKADPEAVLRIVIAEYPEATVTGGPGGFRSIEISRKRGIFKRTETLQINHDPDYYTGASWNTQHSGMVNYFEQFPMDSDRKAKVTAAIEDFSFSLAFVSDPPVSMGDDDFRFDLIVKIATQLDACFFLPGYLLDKQGHVLIDAEGGFEDEAQFPATTSRKMPVSAKRETEKEEIELHPPSAKRVAARAMALAAVSARGLMELNASEQDAGNRLEESRKQAITWCAQIGVDGELEESERLILHTPIGELNERQHLDSIWRFESLAVLLWALQQSELPAYDEVAKPDDLLPAAGFLNPENAKALLSSPALRSADELDDYSQQVFACHWRLRNFNIKPEAMDFRNFGETAWFGPLDLKWAKFDEKNDLALAGTAISEVDRDTLSTCSSIANERHLASNWLKGTSNIYSETDTPT